MLMKKDCEAIAGIVALCRISRESEPRFKEYESGINAACQDIAFRLVEYFEQDNSQFDQQRFLTACGIK